MAIEEKLLRAEEVARMFGVGPATVATWAKQGKITCIRTPGGRRRYLESELLELRAVPGDKPRGR